MPLEESLDETMTDIIKQKSLPPLQTHRIKALRMSFRWRGQLSGYFQSLEHLTEDIAKCLYNKAFSKLQK